MLHDKAMTSVNMPQLFILLIHDVCHPKNYLNLFPSYQNKTTMNQQPKPIESIPSGINQYVRENFKDDFLTDIRPFNNSKGEKSWCVDVTHDSAIHHLVFNSQGELVEKVIENFEYPGEDVEIGDAD